jgi:ATP adenylyltransferase
MERLWTPWRYDYVSRANNASRPGVPDALSGWNDSGAEDSGCVFCNMIAAVDYAIARGMAAEQAEQAVHLLVRGAHCFLCLNAFPYATGHILILPYRHVDSLADLTTEEAQELMSFAQRVETVLRTVYHPNFMTVTADTRILPELLDVTWTRIRQAWQS